MTIHRLLRLVDRSRKRMAKTDPVDQQQRAALVRHLDYLQVLTREDPAAARSIFDATKLAAELAIRRRKKSSAQ